jgi:hypothetical protein
MSCQNFATPTYFSHRTGWRETVGKWRGRIPETGLGGPLPTLMVSKRGLLSSNMLSSVGHRRHIGLLRGYRFAPEPEES